ncbi:hypothetical protein DWW69_01140 [Bacteroides sp. AF16-49]|nr:hypothetical protein DWW69_01140 [Bacteroides sp. AF16-49]
MSLPSMFDRDAFSMVCPCGQISLQRGKEQAVFSAANYIWCIRKQLARKGRKSYSEVGAF